MILWRFGLIGLANRRPKASRKNPGWNMIEERDIYVAMRDGTKLAVDAYRPDDPGKYPVLYASALHNKDLQGPDIADILPPQPAHAPLWFGPIEAGDTRRFVANGYVHVIAQPRGSAKSKAIMAMRIRTTTI
jgi:predicted acyl esterase